MDLKKRAKEMQDFFNNKIDTYDQVHASFMDTKKALVDSLSGDVHKVLDLGAGTGLELIHLFEKYPDVSVTVIDVSESMLEELKKREFADKVTCLCGDFFELSFGDEYDAVISTSALHHFNEEDKSKLYKKVLDCLKKGGEFINCDKVVMSQEEQDSAFQEYNEDPHKYPHMDTPLTKENESKILKNVGFNEVKSLDIDNVKDNYALIKAVK